MAIKVSGETVVTNARRGVFTKMNPGVYETAERPSSNTIGDTIYDSGSKQLVTWNGSAWEGTLPSGAKMLFYQAVAPVGWTKLTDDNISNAALRTVVGTIGGTTAGTTNFSSVFTSRSVPLLAHTHTGNTGNNSRSHTHTGTTGNNNRGHTHRVTVNAGGSHSHGINDPGHTHSYTRRTGEEPFNPGNKEAAKNEASSKTTGSRRTGITVRSAGSHTHGTTCGGISQNHTHTFTTGNVSVNHTHAFTTGSAGTTDASMDFAVKYLNVIVAQKN